MDSYFNIEFCRGPFSLTEDNLSFVIKELVCGYDLDRITSFWEEFSFAEEILETVAQEVGEDSTVDLDDRWLDAVRRHISEILLLNAKIVYIEDNNEATWRDIDGKRWIFSGGQTWDGFTTNIANSIKFVRWSGLDELLAQQF